MSNPYVSPPSNTPAASGLSTGFDPATVIPGGSGSDAEKASRPDYHRPEYDAQRPSRELCTDLMAGSQAIRAKGTTYLPKWPAERPEFYAIRAQIAQVAGYYQRTVQASVGMILATPPVLDVADGSPIGQDWEDIDGQGTHGEVFAKTVATLAMNGGYCGILVDAPPIPEGLHLTLADEQALGLRPFWVPVPADRILSWIVDVPDWKGLLAAYTSGAMTAEQVQAEARQTILRQLVIHEPTDVPAGSFGVQCRDRYRVLRLTSEGVTFTVYEHRKGDQHGGTTGEYFAVVDQGMLKQSGGRPFRAIPFAIVYAGRVEAPFVAAPPLLGLAELNIDHYQVSADRRYLMKLCHSPTLTLSGYQPETDDDGKAKKLEIGPNSVITFQDPQGKASYTAADPAALDSSQVEKEELVRQMAALGMSFLGKDRRGQAETATGRALDDAAENATHATVARGLQDGLEQALMFHALYRGVDAPELAVKTTYAAPEVDDQIATLLWNAVVGDKLDMESWIEYLQTGELPDDIMARLDVLKLAAASAVSADNAAPADPTKADPKAKAVKAQNADGTDGDAPMRPDALKTAA